MNISFDGRAIISLENACSGNACTYKCLIVCPKLNLLFQSEAMWNRQIE